MLMTSLVALLLTAASLQNQESRITKPAAKVDFTHHSDSARLATSRYKVTNFIRNNHSDSRLSVRWEDAGIFCTGTLQLDPGDTDYGTRGGVIDTPALKTNSEIAYGLALQYSALASIYVDPNMQEPKTNTYSSLYERRDDSGKVRFSITVDSSLEGVGTAKTSIRVTGGLSLVFQEQLVGKDPIVSQGWTFSTTRSLDALGLSRDVGSWGSSWVSTTRVPFWDGRVAGTNVYGVLKSRTDSVTEVTFRTHSTSVHLTKVFIAGFYPDKPGVVGMFAYVYLPKEEF
jgi:hypothetical protein